MRWSSRKKWATRRVELVASYTPISRWIKGGEVDGAHWFDDTESPEECEQGSGGVDVEEELGEGTADDDGD